MLQRNTPLARGPGPKRRKGLCAQSRAARRQKREQVKAYAAADDAEQCWCSICGLAGPVERSHLFTQGNYPQHRNNSLNWLVVGKHCGCHSLWEDNKVAFARQYPEAYSESLSRMEAIDPQAYQLFLLKNPPAPALSTIQGGRPDSQAAQ